MAHVLGSPERLVETVSKTLSSEAEKKLGEAKAAAEEIVRKAFEEALSSALRRVEEEARRLSDRLAALEAAKTVELRKKLSAVKARVVEDIIARAFLRARDSLGREGYARVLEGLVRAAVNALTGMGARKIVLVPVERDRAILESIAERLRGEGLEISVSSDSVEGLGGFVAESPEAGIRLDYRVETVYSTGFEEARAVALKALFG